MDINQIRIMINQADSTESAKDILNSLLTGGIITDGDYNEIVTDMINKQILQNHHHSISQHSDGRWRTYVITDTGKRKLIARSTREAVEKAVINHYKTIQRTTESSTDFDTVYKMWRDNHDRKVSDNTISKYNSDYLRYFDNEPFCLKSIQSITEADIENFIFDKVDSLGLCREAVKTFLGYLKGTFGFAAKNRIISSDPTKDIHRSTFYCHCTEHERPADVILVPDDDWSLLFTELQQNIKDTPFYFPPYAILLAAYTGMRVGELAVLKWSDIHTDSLTGIKYIGICRSESYNIKTKQYILRDVKNHKIRPYPVTPQIEELLTLLYTVQSDAGILNDWIFPSETDAGHIHKRNICDALKNRCKKIGVSPKGIHAFRRQINSDLRCDGVSSVITSSLIGNSEAVNEKHYTFDVSGLMEKNRLVSNVNQKRLNLAKV